MTYQTTAFHMKNYSLMVSSVEMHSVASPAKLSDFSEKPPCAPSDAAKGSDIVVLPILIHNNNKNVCAMSSSILSHLLLCIYYLKLIACLLPLIQFGRLEKRRRGRRHRPHT